MVGRRTVVLVGSPETHKSRCLYQKRETSRGSRDRVVGDPGQQEMKSRVYSEGGVNEDVSC